jgi:hypothetical protein
MHRRTITGRSGFPILAGLVFQLLAAQTALPGASLNAPELEFHRSFDVRPIGANIDGVLGTLANVALKEQISRFASVGGVDRKLDAFEAEVSIADGVEQYAGVRGRNRTYQHVSEIRGLWSFGEIVTMLRTTRDIIGSSLASQVVPGQDTPGEGEASASREIRFQGTSADHRWFVTVAGRVYWLDFEGTIRISSKTGEIERLTWRSLSGPPGSGVDSILWDVNFGVATIADIPCTVPSDSIYRVVRTGLGRTAEWNLTRYAAVGRYGSQSTVLFGQ